MYFAPFAPKYDVLPLVIGHFKHRFTDQHWIIYDTSRDYGFFFDGKRVEQISIDNPSFSKDSGKLKEGLEYENEDQYQELWREYFRSIAIAERKNPTLQRNFMPKRFWKYLTEKRI
jgi:probable DNA metabolism protein